MNEISEIKIPEGVDRIAVKQHDDKIVIEFIPEELKNGDLAIFWYEFKTFAVIKIYDRKDHDSHCDSSGVYWKNAIKFESKEQFEKVLRGKI